MAGNSVTAIFTSMHLGNGANSPTLPIQAQDKRRTSTGQVVSPNIERLIRTLGQDQLSAKTIMEKWQEPPEKRALGPVIVK